MNDATKAKLNIPIPNGLSPADGLCTGGQPQAEHLRAAQAQGVRVVINLRPPSEPCDFNEGELVQALGMRYINIPVAGPADLTQVNAQRLADALNAAGDSPVLVHCASGNRVGALFALKARFLDGAGIDDALAAGRATGLLAMEPTVRTILGG
jgi:uncharacterized protein (TIGR01244 family)